MPEDHKNTHLVVIGSSAGGIETLSRLDCEPGRGTRVEGSVRLAGDADG